MKAPTFKIDKCILILFLALFFIGFYLFFSASLATFSNLDRSFDSIFLNQILVSLLALILIYPLSRINLISNFNFLKIISIGLLTMSLFFLFLTLIPFFQPIGNFSANRWLDVGFLFQPIELVKFSLAIYFAFLLFLRLNNQISKIFFSIYLLIPSILAATALFLQPDYDGIIFIIIFTCLNLFFADKSFKKSFLFLAMALIIISPFLFTTDYVKNRILGSLKSQQVEYNLDAIGSGGLWGRGVNQGYDKYFLLEGNTDSIFSVIASELGFLRTLILIMLFFAVTLRGIWIASKLQDTFLSFLVFNFIFIFFFQFSTHIISNLGLLIFIGTPLPLFSKGGTYILMTTISFALIFGASRNLKKQS